LDLAKQISDQKKLYIVNNKLVFNNVREAKGSGKVDQ
jgi:hypothetical protein